LRQRWGIWIGAVLLGVMAARTTVSLFTKGWTFNRACVATGAGFVAWGLWRRPDEGFFDAPDDAEDDDDSPPRPLISIVLLRSSQRYLEPVVLAQALSSAWNRRITAHTPESSGSAEDEENSDGFVAEAGPVYIVFLKQPTAFFMVHNHEGNYFDDAEALAADVPNLRFADIIRHHAAWLSVDLLEKASSPKTLDQAYQLIGKAISALADDQTLALCCPQHQFFNLWDDALDAQLCSAEPLKAFEQEVKAPIIGVSHTGSMEDAIKEAQARWPEFVQAFHSRDKDAEIPFIVKARFTTGDETEHMWLEVFGLEPEYVHGHLMNYPN
jgi:hypothetical protein